MNTVRANAVALLDEQLPALPNSDGSTINMLPFAHDSPQVREIRHQVAEAIINVLANADLLRDEMPQHETVPSHAVAIRCNDCRNALLETRTDAEGNATVKGSRFITAISGLNPQCPHGPITLDDHRRTMEAAFKALEAESEGEQTQSQEKDT